MAVPKPTVEPYDDGFAFTWQDTDLRVSLCRFLEDSESVTAEIKVSLGKVVLHWSRLNLIAERSRVAVANTLRVRVPSEPRWAELLEQVAFIGVEKWREGETDINLWDIPAPSARQWLVEPLLEKGQVTVIYSRGGRGKSTIGLGVALTACCGRPVVGQPNGEIVSVGYLDWEDNYETHKERLDAICRSHQLDRKGGVFYRRVGTSLTSALPSLRRWIVQREIKLVVIDSAGYARGGDPNSPADTMRMYAAARQLGCGVLVLDHISKADARDEEAEHMTAMGTMSTENSARFMWSLIRKQEPGSETAACLLTCTKVNHVYRLPQLAYRLRYTMDERNELLTHLAIEPHDPRDLPELEENLSLGERVKIALHDKAATVKEVAKMLEEKEGSVRTTMNRLRDDKRVERLSNGLWGLAYTGEGR